MPQFFMQGMVWWMPNIFQTQIAVRHIERPQNGRSIVLTTKLQLIHFRKQYSMEHYLDYKSSPKYAIYLKRHKERYEGQKVISESEFNRLSSMFCHYCGTVGPNGIDRIDSSLGYIEGNCVPCCKHCNYVKGNLSMDDFKVWVKRFVTYQATHRIWETK